MSDEERERKLRKIHDSFLKEIEALKDDYTQKLEQIVKEDEERRTKRLRHELDIEL